jgi:hypothetical protein
LKLRPPSTVRDYGAIFQQLFKKWMHWPLDSALNTDQPKMSYERAATQRVRSGNTLGIGSRRQE